MFLKRLKSLSGIKTSKQANNSIMSGYFCIGFTDFMLAGEKLIDFTNFFSPYDFKKNDSIILSYFKAELNW